jgi:hypothetical protein
VSGARHGGCQREAGSASQARVGSTQIEFEAGGSEQRSAEILAESGDARGSFLRFTLRAPNVADEHGRPGKGRVQLSVFGNCAVNELDVSVQVRLSPSFERLKAFPGSFGWLTIAEWWNNATWTQEPYGFRITVNVVKTVKGPAKALQFAVHAQTFDRDSPRQKFKTVWSRVNTDVDVPIGVWFKVRYELVEGNQTNGRFRMTLIRGEGDEKLLFDVQDSTHHPEDPAADGFANINPIKLYTAAPLITFVRDRGGVLSIDWDDLQLRVRSGERNRETR